MVLMLLLFTAFSLSAQSASLYGLSLDDSAILVRLINLRSQDSVSLRLGANRISLDAPGDISTYYPIPADVFILRHHGENTEFLPQQGTVYSILLFDDSLEILEDQAHNDPIRCQLYVYSGSYQQKLSLRTADGNQTLISDIDAGRSSFVSVNPVSVELAIFSQDGRRISEAFDPAMSRGDSIAIALRDSEDGTLIPSLRRAEIQQP